MLNKKALTILLIGPSGSGKGTQAELLSQKYNLRHFQSGEILREIALGKDDFGVEVARSMREGFVPSDWILKIIEKTFSAIDVSHGVVIDGFSRKLPEIKALVSALSKNSRKINFVFILDLKGDVAERRLLKRRICSGCGKILIEDNGNFCSYCGAEVESRNDDNILSIRKRLEDYQNETMPVIEFLEENNFNVLRFDADKPIEELFNNLCAVIENTNQKM